MKQGNSESRVQSVPKQAGNTVSCLVEMAIDSRFAPYHAYLINYTHSSRTALPEFLFEPTINYYLLQNASPSYCIFSQAIVCSACSTTTIIHSAPHTERIKQSYPSLPHSSRTCRASSK